MYAAVGLTFAIMACFVVESLSEKRILVCLLINLRILTMISAND